MAGVSYKLGKKIGFILLLVSVFILLAINAAKLNEPYKPTLQGTFIAFRINRI